MAFNYQIIGEDTIELGNFLELIKESRILDNFLYDRPISFVLRDEEGNSDFSVRERKITLRIRNMQLRTVVHEIGHLVDSDLFQQKSSPLDYSWTHFLLAFKIRSFNPILNIINTFGHKNYFFYTNHLSKGLRAASLIGKFWEEKSMYDDDDEDGYYYRPHEIFARMFEHWFLLRLGGNLFVPDICTKYRPHLHDRINADASELVQNFFKNFSLVE